MKSEEKEKCVFTGCTSKPEKGICKRHRNFIDLRDVKIGLCECGSVVFMGTKNLDKKYISLVRCGKCSDRPEIAAFELEERGRERI